MDLQEAKSKITCNPKKIKELLFQFGFDNNNLKSEINLMSAVVDKCMDETKTSKKTKKDGPKRAPSPYAKHIKECWDVHRSENLGFKKTNEICRLEWKEKKGKT